MKAFSKKLVALMILGSTLGSAQAFASDSVTSANIEDISAFDSALAKQQKARPAAAAKPQNFGSEVSAKAKELRVNGPDASANFGSSIADQRRNNNGSSNGANMGNGNANAASSAAGNGGGKPPNPRKPVK